MYHPGILLHGGRCPFPSLEVKGAKFDMVIVSLPMKLQALPYLHVWFECRTSTTSRIIVIFTLSEIFLTHIKNAKKMVILGCTVFLL